MAIRQAEVRDSAGVFWLAQAFATSLAVEQPAFERAFVELLSDPKAFIAVAEVEGKVAGYILGFEHLTFFVNGRVAWVEEIMVSEEHRRTVIGQQLMEAFRDGA